MSSVSKPTTMEIAPLAPVQNCGPVQESHHIDTNTAEPSALTQDINHPLHAATTNGGETLVKSDVVQLIITKSDQTSLTPSKKGPKTGGPSSPSTVKRNWRFPLTFKSKDKDFQWEIRWYMPACMVILTLVGICAMLGHHIYNSRLQGRQVKDPQWPQRWGLALSTFGKMCLAGAVEIAYRQRVWVGFYFVVLDVAIRLMNLRLL